MNIETSISKIVERQFISKKIREWLAAGNTVTICPPALSGMWRPKHRNISAQ